MQGTKDEYLGMIWINIGDPRLLESRYIKWTDASFPRVDSYNVELFILICHDLMQIIPVEHTLQVNEVYLCNF